MPREHEPEGEPCWCKETYPVKVGSTEVGIATPLDDGNYSIAFHETVEGHAAHANVRMGMMRGMSIHDPHLLYPQSELDLDGKGDG